MKNIKTLMLVGIMTSSIYASNFSYNIYLKFDLTNNKNIAERYNKIVSDTISIIKKGGNNENKCQFKMAGPKIFIKCSNITKKTIPLMNIYVNNNVYNQQDLLNYEIIRTDQEILPIIKKKSETIFNKIKSFFK